MKFPSIHEDKESALLALATAAQSLETIIEIIIEKYPHLIIEMFDNDLEMAFIYNMSSGVVKEWLDFLELRP